MKLTQEELRDFPLQPGIRLGVYFEVAVTEDGRRLTITCDSAEVIPHEYLRYGGHVYRFAWLGASSEGPFDDAALNIVYKAT